VIPFQFGADVAGAPPGAAVGLLFGRCADAVVEFDATAGRTWVLFDRVAPSMLDAVVSGVRDLDAAGLVALAIGPDDEVITAGGVAARLGLGVAALEEMLAATAPGGRVRAPRPVWHCVGEPLYRWPDVTAWLDVPGFDPSVPEVDSAVFEAVTLTLRLRALAPWVGRIGAIRSLLVDRGDRAG
jgi:hypothetical protein